MVGITDLGKLLSSMQPELMPDEFVFCTAKGSLEEYVGLNPLAMFKEREGITLILKKEVALQHKLPFESIFSQITLTVHSSLDAVGLTAAVATKLADRGVSANVVAAYFHDHIFVQQERAIEALTALKEFSS